MFQRFDLILVSVDQSKEEKKLCLVISPDEMNKYIKTLIVAPITNTTKDYPTHITVYFNGKNGKIALSQIFTIDKKTILKKVGTVDNKTSSRVLKALMEMFQ